MSRQKADASSLEQVRAELSAKKDNLDAVEEDLEQAEKVLNDINAQKVNNTIKMLEESERPEALAKALDPNTIQEGDELPAQKPRDATELD